MQQKLGIFDPYTAPEPPVIEPPVMQIHVYLLCYNEAALLPHTINHYKTFLPSCIITIYDNESSDNSVEIAKSLGCNVVTWSSNNIIDDFKYLDIKNNCWKDIQSGWIIMADMDEFLCVTENELLAEMNNSTTILTTRGIDILGESETIDLSDVDLSLIKKYTENPRESKKLCFLREKITDMNYNFGAHECNPNGDSIVYSSKNYLNKHMAYLGLPYITHKMIKRYERSELMRSQGMAIHYTDNSDNIKNDYITRLTHCKYLMKFIFFYSPIYDYYNSHINNNIGGIFDVESMKIDDLNNHSHHTFFGGVSIKIELIIQKIKENFGDTILFTDATIFINSNNVRQLPDFLHTYINNDLCFADNDGFGYYNIGVILIRCSIKTLCFFENVLADLVSNKGWDQDVINNHLHNNNNLKIDVFDRNKIYCDWDFNVDYKDTYLIYKSFIHHSKDTIKNYNMRLDILLNSGLICHNEYNINYKNS